MKLCARLYNYSLFQPTGNFKVRFYGIVIDNGVEVGDLFSIGDPQTVSLDSIAKESGSTYYYPDDQAWQDEFCVEWDTTGFSDTVIDGKHYNTYRLYVIIDEDDEVKNEIHEWKGAGGKRLSHGNNEGYWPWKNSIQVISKASLGETLSEIDISLNEDSLGIERGLGLEPQGPIEVTLGKTYDLRVRIHSTGNHPHYRWALFYDGDPKNGGRVFSSQRVFGLTEGDNNYIWAEWTPKEPGDNELWVALLEDSDEPNPGNASDMLKVSVYQHQPMACCEVNFMKATDKKKRKSDDKIKIKGSLKLVQWAEPFEPETDIVRVTIDDQVITIPAGSFEAKHTSGLIQYSFKGDIPDVGHVHMRLNFDECRWSIDIRGKDAADLVQNDGASVGLTIGTNAGEDSFEWTRKTKRSAMFNEAPPLLCCCP